MSTKENDKNDTVKFRYPGPLAKYKVWEKDVYDGPNPLHPENVVDRSRYDEYQRYLERQVHDRVLSGRYESPAPPPTAQPAPAAQPAQPASTAQPAQSLPHPAPQADRGSRGGKRRRTTKRRRMKKRTRSTKCRRMKKRTRSTKCRRMKKRTRSTKKQHRCH